MSKYSPRGGDVAGLLERFAHPGEGAGALAAASTGGLKFTDDDKKLPRGANLTFLGRREPAIYGTATAAELYVSEHPVVARSHQIRRHRSTRDC